MRILQVSPSETGGGAEAIALQLFQAYRRRGYQSWLAVGLKQNDDPDVFCIPNDACRSRWARTWLGVAGVFSPWVGRIRGAGLLQRSVRLGIGQPRRWRDLQLGREDFEFPGTRSLLTLPPEMPDLLHCHNLHASWLPDGGYFDLRVLPWLSHQLPVVLTLHDAWLLSGHCAYSFDCERWQDGCGHCPDLTIYPAVRKDATDYNWWRKRDILSSSRIFVSTPSDWLMQRVTRSFVGAYAVEGRVIPNGVDLSLFCPADKLEARRALGLPAHAKIVLFAATDARKNIWKDFATAREAIRRVAEGLGGDELLFLVLGDHGPSERVGRARMSCIPYVSDCRTVGRYYQAADVYLHAARVESWGLTITEALACGTPVVATAIGGIPEQMDDERTGFLVASGDPQGLAARLRQLLCDEALRKNMGDEAARIARVKFDQEQQIAAYLGWYQDILDCSQRTRHTPAIERASLPRTSP